MTKKKALCLLLSLVMVCGLLPTTALAAGSGSDYGDELGEVTGGSYTDTSADPEKSYEYFIIGSNGTVASAVYTVEEGEDSSEVVEEVGKYERVSSIADGRYVMVAANNKAILADTTYSGEVTVSDDVLTSAIDDSYLWTITTVNDGYTIRNNDNNYLYILSANQAKASAVQVRAASYTLKIASVGNGTDAFYISGQAVTGTKTGYLTDKSSYTEGISTQDSASANGYIYLYQQVSGYQVTDAAIAAATSGVKSKASYTDDSWEAYEDALAAAKEVYGSEEDAASAYNTLLTAVNALEDSGMLVPEIIWERTLEYKYSTQNAGDLVTELSFLAADDGSGTYPKLSWDWDSISGLTTDPSMTVWDYGTAEQYSDKASSEGVVAATWNDRKSDGTYPAGEWTKASVRKFSGTFVWPEGYDLDDTAKLVSVNDENYSEIYNYVNNDPDLADVFGGKTVLAINDDMYVFMYLEGTTLSQENYLDYLVFWTGSSGKGAWSANAGGDDWKREVPATYNDVYAVRAFHGVYPNLNTKQGSAVSLPETVTSKLQHSDSWYSFADTGAIATVLNNNYASDEMAGKTVHIDIYCFDNDGNGGMDKLELQLTKRPLTSQTVEVRYWLNEVSTVDSVNYLGSSSMTGVLEGTQVTLAAGTDANQLNFKKAAAITANSNGDVTDGTQVNSLTVTKNGPNVIDVVYLPEGQLVVTLTAETKTAAYTGSEITASEVTVSETSQQTFTVTDQSQTVQLKDKNWVHNAKAVCTQTLPGIYSVTFNGDAFVTKEENGGSNNALTNYTVYQNPGTLTITYEPVDVTYTYDFGVTNSYTGVLAGKNNVETQVTNVRVKGDAAEYVTIDKDTNTITYTPQSANRGETVTLELVFAGDYTVEKNITFVPATNVLYEENLVTFVETSVSSIMMTNGDWTRIGTSSDNTIVDDNDSTVYGYTDIDAYAASEGFSNGSAYQAELTLAADDTTAATETAATFSFTGTGFDLISECGTDTGMLLVKVSNSAGKAVVAYLVDTYFTGDGAIIDAENSEDSILDYQVPVVRNLNLPYGTYTVTVYGYLVNTAGAVSAAGGASSANYGLRNNDSVSGGSMSVEDIVAAALEELGLWDELDVDDVEVSFMSENSVLNGGSGNTASAGSSASFTDSYGVDLYDVDAESSSYRGYSVSKSNDTSGTMTTNSSVTANVYIDGFRVYKPLETDAEIYTTDGENDVKYYSVYDFIENSVNDLDNWVDNAFVYVEYDGDTETAAIADYKIQGPQNEVYLTRGSGIAFALENYEEGDVVQLAMKSVGTIDATANEAKDMSATSATEMYYEVDVEYDEDLDVNYVVITNNEDSTGILALSGLKLSSHITAMGSEALGEKVSAALDKSAGEKFVPKVLTASAPGSVKSGRNATISVESSTDDVAYVKLFIDGAEDEILLNPTNTKAVAAGKSDVYKYSYVVKTKTLKLSEGEHTFTIYAYDAEDHQSAPVTLTITVTG